MGRVSILVLTVSLAAALRVQVARKFAPEVISTPKAAADAPAFTPDGRTVVFDGADARKGSTLYVSNLQNGRWSAPRVAPFSGRWIDQDPAMAPGGTYLIFASNRPRRPGGKPLPGWTCNLWRVDRGKDGRWGTPAWLPAVVNRPGHDLGAPSLARDGTLYFLDHNLQAKRGRAFVAHPSHPPGGYMPPLPVRIEAADRMVPDDIAIAPHQQFMVFDVLSRGHSRFYFSFRQPGRWGQPRLMNVGGGENWDPRLGPDGRTLYFTSNRGGHTAVWWISLGPWLSASR